MKATNIIFLATTQSQKQDLPNHEITAITLPIDSHPTVLSETSLTVNNYDELRSALIPKLYVQVGNRKIALELV